MIKHKNNLSLLYRYVTDDLRLQKSYYRLILFYSSQGHIQTSDICEIRQMRMDEDYTLFETKEELMAFANDTLEYYKVKRLHILSSTDFNIGIESAQDISALKEIFERYGTEVKLLVSENEGRGFLDSFFKK